MARRKDRKKGKGKRGRRSAPRDKYVLYQECVQEPSFDVEFFPRLYREYFGRDPRLFREDFCGTAALCCEWVRRGEDRRAIGYDLDPEPLDWCRKYNFQRLTPEQRERVSLFEQDVRTPTADRADVLSCQNFSPNFFYTRDELRAYFRAAYDHLADEGILTLDVMGGSEVIEEDFEVATEQDGYDYIWHQKRFDPISSRYECEIFFRFPDDDPRNEVPAFRYDWRLWSLTELRELLAEAGFPRSDVYWEGVDEDDEGNGEFERVETAPSEPAWVCYLIGVKKPSA